MAFHSRSSRSRGLALAAQYPGASYTGADLADDEQARGLIRQVLERHGRLDVMVNNAAISKVVPHADLAGASADLWRSHYQVNVIAPWTLITEAEAALRRSATPERPSCVLNISSHAGVRPEGASIPYAVSKAAPAIRVNAIAPGLVDTALTRDWHAAQDLWRERSPMRRAARADEIADLAAMIIASPYLTGEVLVADGGLNLT